MAGADKCGNAAIRHSIYICYPIIIQFRREYMALYSIESINLTNLSQCQLHLIPIPVLLSCVHTELSQNKKELSPMAIRNNALLDGKFIMDYGQTMCSTAMTVCICAFMQCIMIQSQIN